MTDDGHNPFATRYVRPGALGYLFPAGLDAKRLVDRLRASGWWGQIVGPHGSGKSSLVAALAPALANERRLIAFSLHDGQRRLDLRRIDRISRPRIRSFDVEPPADASLVLVDGYEQLSLLSKRALKRLCRRRAAGLLVTAHASVGLPTLWVAQPELATAQRIVAALMPAGDATIGPHDVARAWQVHQGNLRELLFDLYGVYEQRRG